MSDWTVEFKTDGATFDAHQDEIVAAITQEATRVYLGYVLCRDCQTAITDQLAKVTGGRCTRCLRNRFETSMREVEILVDGARTTVPVPGRRRRGSKGSRQTRNKADQAKRRAMRRLRYAMPDLYVALLAQERERLGLDPSPLSLAVHTGTIIDVDPYDQANGPPNGDAPGDAAEPERG